MIEGKVWGSTELLVKTPMIEVHRINIDPGMECSTHKHEHKWNGFYCVEGYVEIHVDKNDYDLTDVTCLTAGDFTAVKPGEFHKFQTGDMHAVVLEIYWLEGISTDIVRKNAGGKWMGETRKKRSK